MKKMLNKIFLTGSNGMLGSSLVPYLCNKGYEVLSTDIDISGENQTEFLDVRDLNSVDGMILRFDPDVVMHLAAETDVDRCEEDVEHASLTNTIGTQNVALTCRKYSKQLLYMSTVGVFDGKKSSLYLESDNPNPINVYGVTKYEGEKIVRNLIPNHYIVRSGWMFGGGPDKDKKFVGKIVKQIKDGSKELTIVNDKIGTPTYTYKLSEHLEKIITSDLFGTYHCCCRGVCSRIDVAKKIIDFFSTPDKISIKEVPSSEYPLPAPRPYSECMDNLMLRLRKLDTMPHWEECLKEYLQMFV